MQGNPILNSTSRTAQNFGVALVSIIWLLAIAAAAGAALLRHVGIDHIWPVAAIACIPAIVTLLLWPMLSREWAQITTIFVWIALAIIASFSFAFFPMAILFLLAPAVAALFEREKVVEAMALSAIFAAAVYYARAANYGPESITSDVQNLWGTQTGLIATISAILAAMFAAASSKSDAQSGLANPAAVNGNGTGFPLIGNYPGPAMRFDARGRLRDSTDAANTLLSIVPTDLSTLNIRDLLAIEEPQASALEAAFYRASKEGEGSTVSVRAALDHQDGLVDLKLDLLPAGFGHVYMFACHAQDLAERVTELESSRAQAEKDAEDKTLFFAGVSHELRTPLNAIIGFSDMMRSRLFGPLPGKYGEYADLIHESGQHMLDLIGDVLDLSKVEAGKYSLHKGDFDAADVIRSSMKMLRPGADAAQVHMDADIDDNDPLIVHADRKALRQILLNLLSNAIKFTPKGGRVMISATSAGGQLSIRVKDNGAGMSPQELARIGEPYQQGASSRMIDNRGSGLGLSLVKSLVDLHAGTFDVKSKLGAGTTVEIRLPIEDVTSS